MTAAVDSWPHEVPFDFDNTGFAQPAVTSRRAADLGFNDADAASGSPVSGNTPTGGIIKTRE